MNKKLLKLSGTEECVKQSISAELSGFIIDEVTLETHEEQEYRQTNKLNRRLGAAAEATPSYIGTGMLSRLKWRYLQLRWRRLRKSRFWRRRPSRPRDHS